MKYLKYSLKVDLKRKGVNYILQQYLEITVKIEQYNGLMILDISYAVV